MKQIPALGLAALLGFGQPAWAQVPLPTVAKIKDFFTQVVAEVEAGVKPRLVSLGTPASQKVLGQTLKVRVFSLTANRDRPEDSGTRGDCVLFISRTYAVRVDGNSLELMPTTDDWLQASTIENTVSAGRYLVVLESAAESRNDFLLLDRKHQEDYFASGMLLVVKPTKQPAKAQILEAFKARRRALESVELEVARQIGGLTCYGFKRLVAGFEADYNEQLAACTAPLAEREG